MEERPLNSRLEAQAEKREQLLKERKAAKSLYLDPAAAPLLEDLQRFIETQVQGCKDLAATTDSEFIATRNLHMLLMGDIISSYITNQRTI